MESPTGSFPKETPGQDTETLPTKPTGVSDVAWNNLDPGWTMYCLCDEFATVSHSSLAHAAEDMEDHWRDDHGWEAP